MRWNGSSYIYRRKNYGGDDAFTLVELLVTISIIGILCALLLPALASAKKRGQGTYCMNNSRQMALAVHLYNGDNKDYFPPNPDDANTMEGYNWCCGNFSGGIAGMPPGSETFDPGALENQNKSLLTRYLQNVAVFQCPADPRYGLYTGKASSQNGKQFHATRSISMNQGVGTTDPAYDSYQKPDNHSGAPTLSVNGPWLDGHHSNKRNNPYATFGKSSDFSTASASDIFLMLDESPFTINDAAFAVSAGVPMWVDGPANFHGNACGFSFCDGHAEIHRWSTGTLNFGLHNRNRQPLSADNPDWTWLVSHSTVKLH